MTKESLFSAKSSTRVDLSGGTLDLWPLSTLVSSAGTINCSIDCYTEVSFEPGPSMVVDVKSPDFKERFEFANLEDFKNCTDSKMSLLKEAFSILEEESLGLGKWTLSSESPAGSGLGGSSSLLISILKVLFQVLKRKPWDAELIETAKNIESRVLKGPAGIQDYFSPVKKGLNCICYKESGFVREQMLEALSFIGPCLTIVDSEIKHHSGMNNWDILKRFVDGDLKVKAALEEISKINQDLKLALNQKSFEGLQKAFEQEFEARKDVSDSYINKDLEVFLAQIQKIEEVRAFKVCGAGGGGCVLLLHQPSEKEDLIQALKDKSISVLPFSLIGS